MNNGFRVGPSLKTVAVREVATIQIIEVIDLAIEGDLDGAVLVRERLVPALSVDNGQPPVPQSDPWRRVETFVIRPAMTQRVSHRFDPRKVDGGCTPGFEDAADSAHSF